MGVISARFEGIQPVIWGLRSANPGLREYSLLTRAVVRLCAKLSSVPWAIILNSEKSRTVHAQLGYSPARMKTIPNGIDTRKFRPDPQARKSVREELGCESDSLLLGMFARYSPMKDHKTFLRAAALVRQQHGYVRFLLAGEGVSPENPALRELVREYQLQQAVYLLGPRRDVARLTAALDVACLSSWSESFPNVILEAMACAVPCAVTSAGDSSLIIGDAGQIAPSSDPGALAEAMGKLISLSAAERTALGQRARERAVAHFSMEASVRQCEALYLRVVEPPSLPVQQAVAGSRTT
jgi:glycosyltransferase involved in cell wall biosynthesis